ncbi:MAG: hypothetical protein U0269_02625 [Polyangiales bacterium]
MSVPSVMTQRFTMAFALTCGVWNCATRSGGAEAGDVANERALDAADVTSIEDVSADDAAIAPLDVARPSSWVKPVRVLALAFDPIVEPRSNARLHEVYRWNDPSTLAPRAVDALVRASGGAARFEVVSYRTLDSYGRLVDGFEYDDATFAACWQDSTHARCHNPQGLDYAWLVRTYDLCGGITRGEYDEVWLFGAPYFGYWESTMVGPGAFFLNSQPVRGVSCDRTFVIMGFNYERGLAEMLHDYGHRAEFTMAHATVGLAAPTSWTLFSRYDRTSAGNAGCGNTHNPPNAQREYDYANAAQVPSNCDAFLTYPTVTAPAQPTGCAAWGCNEEGYQRWWLDHVPRADGMSNGLQNNWWKYIVGFEEFL